MKHWTQYLPEAGSIEKEAFGAICLMDKINHYNKQIIDCLNCLKHEDDRLYEIAIKHWTKDEIKKAQNLYLITTKG